VLVVLITILGPISGAHFNPVVSAMFVQRGELAPGEAAGYVAAQITGGLLGVLLAHAMFDLALLQVSTKLRTGPAQWLSEAVATFGLIMVNPGRTAVSTRGYSGARWIVHHGCLLVHGIDEFCQSRGDRGTQLHQYLCWDRAGKCAWIYRCPMRGCSGGCRVVPLAI
jgi:glycerol uptake facilitator-like aquaporin